MNGRVGRLATVSALVGAAVIACGDTQPVAMADQEVFEAIAPGEYYITVGRDSDAPLRVVFTVAEEGWLSWTGTYKEQAGEGNQLVGSTIAAASHVVADPCRQHSWEDPGDSVDDLARALTDLPGLEVTAAPREVTAFDHQGMYFELAIPQLAHEPGAGFTDCVGGNLYTYRGQGEWGRTLERFHQGPGQILQFWILDVDGVRLLIEANRFPDSPAEDVEELQAIVDSIRIES